MHKSIAVVLGTMWALYAGIFPPSTPAADPVAYVMASTILNGAFPERESTTGHISGYAQAFAKDNITYTDPRTHLTVFGNVNASAIHGKLKLYNNLAATSPASITGVVKADAYDEIVWHQKTTGGGVSSFTFKPKFGGTVTGKGTYGGVCVLVFTICNKGSDAHPKDERYVVDLIRTWGYLGASDTTSGPRSFTFQNGDRYTILVHQELACGFYGPGKNGEYMYVEADFSHTTTYYFDPDTSDVTMTSASGHDYRSPKTAVHPNAWSLYQ